MWPIYNIVTIQDEGGKSYLNLIYIISKWCTMKLLAILLLFFKTQDWLFILEKDLKFVMHKV
jgi:hypothetical protein